MAVASLTALMLHDRRLDALLHVIPQRRQSHRGEVPVGDAAYTGLVPLSPSSFVLRRHRWNCNTHVRGFFMDRRHDGCTAPT